MNNYHLMTTHLFHNGKFIVQVIMQCEILLFSKN